MRGNGKGQGKRRQGRKEGMWGWEGRREEAMDGKSDDLEKWRIGEILGFGYSSLQVSYTTLLTFFF